MRLVRFRNCFSEPDDMYSVMKMTCNLNFTQIIILIIMLLEYR